MSGNDEEFPINVKSINNDIYPFTVNNATTVNELKIRIKDTTSISEDRQRLIYRGRVLADDTCIGDYRIESGHTIQFVARPENYRELQQQAAASSAPTSVPRMAPVPVPGPLPTAGGNNFMDIIMRDILTAANFPAAPVAVRRIPATPANIVNNSAAMAALQALDSEDNMEHVRQGLLTLNTIMSTMNPENFAPEVDVPIHSNSSASETAEDSDRDSPPPLIPLDSVEDEEDEEDVYTPISDTADAEIAASEEQASEPTEEQSPEVEPERESEHHSEQDEPYDDEEDEWESIPDDEEAEETVPADFEVQREEIQAERRRIAARAAEMRSSSNSNNNSNSNDFNNSNKLFYIGQWVDCKDTVQTWLEATVMNVDERNRKVFIHYNGWPSERWDEWISMDSPRLSPFRSRTVHSNTTHPQFISPAPNCRTARQPVTGYDDVRTLLPQLASMFRRLQPMIEEAAELAEQSLREDANYPPGTSESFATPEGTEPLLPIAAGMPWDAVVRHSALYSGATGVASTSSNNNALARAAEFLTEVQSQRRPVSARDAHSPHRTGDIWTPEEIQSVPVRSALPQRVPLSFTSASPGRPLRTAADDNEDEERDEAIDNNDNNDNEENEENDSDSDDEDQQQEQQRTIDLIHNIMGGLVAAQGNLNAAANGGAGTGGTVRTTQTPTEGNTAPQSEFGAFLSAATVPFARTYTVSADGSVNAVEIPATQQPAMTLQQLAQSPLTTGSQSTAAAAAAGGASGSTAQTSDSQQGSAARPVVTQPTGPGGLPLISIQSEEAMASFMNSLLAGSGIAMIPPPGRLPATGSAGGGSSAQSAGQSSSTSNLDPSMMHNEAEEEYNYFFNLLSPDAHGAAASTGNSSSTSAVEQGRDARLRYLTREMTPLLDRFGRVLSDISPHLHAFSERNSTNGTNNRTEVSSASSSGNGSNNSAATEPFFAASEGLRNDMTLQQNLISLMRRPPSPPPDRAYRSPLRVQQLPETTRISTGIPAGSSGSGVYLASPGIGQQPRLVSLVGGNGIASILGQQLQDGGVAPATSASTSATGVAQQQSGGQPPRVQMRVLSVSSSGNPSTTTNATGAATITPASSTTRTVPNSAVPQPIDSAVIQSLSNRATQLQAQVQDIAQRSQELSERTTAATNYSHQLNEIIRGIHTVEEIRDSRRRIQEISAQIDAIRARALGAQSTSQSSSVTETEPLLPDATARSDSQPNEQQQAAEVPDLVTGTSESSSSGSSTSVASTSVANTSIASGESGGAERTASIDINLDSSSSPVEEGEDNIEALFMQGIRRFLDQETERRSTEESVDEENEHEGEEDFSDGGEDDEGLLDDLDVHTHAVAHPTLLEPSTVAATSPQTSPNTNSSNSNNSNVASGGLAGVRPLMECNEHRMNESITQNLQFYNRNLVPPTATAEADLVVEDLETYSPEEEQSGAAAAAADVGSGVSAVAQSAEGDCSEDVTTEQTAIVTAIAVDEEPNNNQPSSEPNRNIVAEQSLVGESSATAACVEGLASEGTPVNRVDEEQENQSNSAADVSANANSPTSGNRRPSFFQRVKSSLSFKGNNKDT